MIIRLHSNPSDTECLDEGSATYVRSLLQVRHPRFWAHPKVKNHQWDGYYKFCSRGKFPTGLVPTLYRLHKEGLQPHTFQHTCSWQLQTNINLRRIPDVLHQEQHEAVVKSLTYVFRGKKWWPRGIIAAATSSGKTFIMAGVAAAVPNSVLIVTDSKILLYQNAEVLGNLLQEPIGLIGDGQCSFQRVTIAIIDSLNTITESRDGKRFLQMQDALFLEECHHAGSNEYKILKHCLAPIRLGFSATPFNPDNEPNNWRIKGLLGDTLVTINDQALVEKGRVAKVECYYVKAPGLYQDLPFDLADKEGAYQKLIVENTERNQLFIRFAETRTRPTLTLVEHVAHGEYLAKEIGCDFLHGKHSIKERRHILGRLGRGEILNLVATKILDEGVNVPAIKYLGLAAGFQSPGRFKQRVGRGRRKTEDNQPLRVLDTWDGTNDTLESHSKRRLVTAHESGYKIIPWEQSVEEIP